MHAFLFTQIHYDASGKGDMNPKSLNAKVKNDITDPRKNKDSSANNGKGYVHNFEQSFMWAW